MNQKLKRILQGFLKHKLTLPVFGNRNIVNFLVIICTDISISSSEFSHLFVGRRKQQLKPQQPQLKLIINLRGIRRKNEVPVVMILYYVKFGLGEVLY
jgi:hypothetical protein